MDKVKKNIEICKSYLEKCYSPYSNFNVVAMIVGKDYKIIGVNVENCSYGLTVCAEANCITNGITVYGYIENPEYMIILTNTADKITPCGSCRQIMAEFLPGDIDIHTVGKTNEIMTYKLCDLIPHIFVK